MTMDEQKTASSTVTAKATTRSWLIWPLTAGMLVIGLLLLNVDTIGRVATEAYDATRLRSAERRQAARQVTAGAEKPTPADAAVPPSGKGNAGMPADDTRVTAPSAPSAPPQRSLERPLQRLYPAPPPTQAAVPPTTAPARPRPAADGRAGLAMLVRAGALRPASGNALARWKSSYASNNPRPVGARFDEWTRMMPVYEIVGDMTFPDGLGGANAAVFLLGERAPYPAGNPGHSVILDSASGSCIGVTCGMLLGAE
jgi:hypothetical protein